MTSPLPYVVVSQDLVYTRSYLEKLQGRAALRHVRMYSEELVEDRGLEGKALTWALNAYRALKYIHMYEGQGIVSLKPATPNDSWIVILMRRVRNHIRDVGYPHRDHDGVASGPTYAPLEKGCDEAALLPKMALTIIVDGNMKACYKISQHQYGERYIDEATGLSLHAQCKASRSRGSLYCHDHAPLQAGNHFDDDNSISTRIRLQVKLGKDEGACQKTLTVYARHSAGFLGAFRQCGVCVGRRPLATAESENEVAYCLHTLTHMISQHQYGERYIDEATGLSLHAQCKASRSRGSLYCHDHAPLQAGNHFDDDNSISTRIRLQVKLGKDEGACQKTLTVYARHSAGFLGAFRQCGVCVGRRPLATAESENEVAYCLHTLTHMILRCRQIPKFSCRTTAGTAAVTIFPPPQAFLAHFARFVPIPCAVKQIEDAQSANRNHILLL